MAYKSPPDTSIEGAGGIEPYVDNFFAKRGQPYTYSRDVLPLFHKKLSWNSKGTVVDVAGSTFKKWQTRYNLEHEISSR